MVTVITLSDQHRYFWTGGFPGWLAPRGDSGTQASFTLWCDIPGAFISSVEVEKEGLGAG